jgi:alpha-galactosidase
MSNTTRKITFIGAGSTVFAKNLLGDILSFPELGDSAICLFDIDENRLKTSEVVARRIAQTLGAPVLIEATTDRSRALEGASYAINMIQVGGYKPCTVTDFEIPKRYGLRQTIADTLGIGGIMRALRTIPVLIELCHEMERVCPEVVHLNYVNPMAMNCWALNRATRVRTIGLCHSVQHTAEELAHDLGLPIEEINYVVAGINHMAFYLRFERNGEDLYPEIWRVIGEGRVPDTNRVRYDVFKRLGYFVTESSEHFSEYVPWFIKRNREDLVKEFNIPLDEYPRRCEAQITEWERLRNELENPDAPLEVKRSVEYGSLIIHSLETGIPRVVYGNVANAQLIENLPEGCCVEVPCVVDKNGLQPVHIGMIPPQLAALMQTNINVQALTVEAILEQDPRFIYHAAMLDPHTAAELDLDQIWALVDDLIAAHGEWIPKPLREVSPESRAASLERK